MAYKITIPRRGAHAGEVTVETLDSTSCAAVHDVTQHLKIISSVPVNHGDDVPVHDQVHIVE
ncbi:MAG: hypothetical protein PHF86_06355 [Candidatus Nanoarchaeia archaeon]|nr:hypothetical protein [Candidatus Nanoarchaeia archaeon]